VTRRRVAAGQGAFYAVTGLWSVLFPGSFQRVTGHKLEGWLLKTVGCLVTVNAAALLQAARHDRVTPEIALLGAGAAASLGGIDAYYAARRRIHWIYMADAGCELGIVALWALARRDAPLAPPLSGS